MDLENAKFIVASGPVIIENGKVLLNRHGHKDEKNNKKEKLLWKFVGGRVENFDFPNELDSLEDACKREVKEEMGIDIEIIQAIKPMMIKHPEKKDTMVVLIHYLAKRVGQIKSGSDIEEYEWFDINRLPVNCAPNIKPVIEEYKRLINQSKNNNIGSTLKKIKLPRFKIDKDIFASFNSLPLLVRLSY